MNTQIFTFLNSFALQNKTFDALVFFLAEYLPYLLVLGAVIFLFLHRDKIFSKKESFTETLALVKLRVKEIMLVFFTAISAWLVSFIIKHIFASPRPFEILSNVRNIFFNGGYDSFPSGHATFFSALGLSLLFIHKKVGIFFLICAFLIGISRIIAGVHFPVDILGGFIIGSTVAWVMSRLLNIK